ncbi:MAG: hypothetical protein ONB23_06320 [candidate division KSB1 bacterium]|nr:hypothetical protein [candidate division KSB1 bacterium]
MLARLDSLRALEEQAQLRSLALETQERDLVSQLEALDGALRGYRRGGLLFLAVLAVTLGLILWRFRGGGTRYT